MIELESKLTPLLQLVEEIQWDKLKNELRDNGMTCRKERVDDMEQQARVKNVILTGLQFKSQPRPDAASDSTEANGGAARECGDPN